MSASKKEFERLLEEAIDESLVKVFGQTAAKSVVFYIDTNLALADPGNYARSLEQMFRGGAKEVLDSIIDNLSQKSGVPKDDSKSFKDFVLIIKLSVQEGIKQKT